MILSSKPALAFGQQLAQTLRLQIVAGDLADGQKLSENMLAAQFGSSRAPVREALKTLEYEGLVSLTKQGVIVRGLAAPELDELYDIRYMLEMYCLTHIKDDLLPVLADRLEVLVDRMALALKHKDFEEFASQDIQFHNLPFEYLAHRFIPQFWGNIKGLYQTVLYVGTKHRFDQGDYTYKEEAVEKHGKMVEALRSGDRPLIEKALKEHFSRVSWIDKSEF